MSVLDQLRYFTSIGDRLGYYGVLSANGDQYGDLAAGVVTNATLSGAVANTLAPLQTAHQVAMIPFCSFLRRQTPGTAVQ